MLANERFQLAHELRVPPEGEVGVDPQLERAHAELLQADDLHLRPVGVRSVGERRAAPELQRVVQEARGVFGRRRLRVVHEPLEGEQVELVRGDADQVAGLLRDDDLSPAERLPELRDVVLQRVRRVARRRVAPHRVDQHVRGDDLVRPQEQEREQGALTLAAEHERMPVRDDLERPQDPELHRCRRR